MNHSSSAARHASASLILAVSLAACLVPLDDTDVSGQSTGHSSHQVTSGAVMPATCADIRASAPDAPDGEYQLFVAGDRARPWSAFCHDMAGTPREYLLLSNTGNDRNFSQYTAGGASQGTDVRTSYSKIRVDPVDLSVDIADVTFATSTGSLTHTGTQTVSFMPFGAAMSCDDSASGVANIDLTGTPFAVDNSFCQGGYVPLGSADISASGQIVDLTGGGYCGYTSPQPCSQDPFNGPGGTQIQLSYFVPATCADIAASNPDAGDGEYVLYVGPDASKPWTAYCHDMAGTPREYLSLSSTGNDRNFSQYTAGGASQGNDVRTRYSKIRVDPVDLSVDIADVTFATSTGSLTHTGTQTVSFMPFGAAMSCDDSASGVANIDLTGTPFAVVNGFCQGGYVPLGSADINYSGQVVDLTGGGYCGYTSPQPCSQDPFNGPGGTEIQLSYIALSTCAEIAASNPDAGDGEYELLVGADVSKPWTAYCHDMAGTPREYLTLQSTGTDQNYSQYTAGGASQGNDVRTRYSKIRVDRVDLSVDIADVTFATSTGSLTHTGTETVAFMPFGAAMSCDDSASGVANIDLTGTPFAVDNSFCQGGYVPLGSADINASGQIVDLTGGGYCGYTSPQPCSQDPFNGPGGTEIQLSHSAPL